MKYCGFVASRANKLFECFASHLSGVVHMSTVIGFLYVVKVKYQPRARLPYVSVICFNYQQLWLGLAKVVSICGNISYTCIVFLIH